MGDTPSIYLVNPRSPIPSYVAGDSYDHYGLPRATFAAELALPTVAALVPPDFDVQLCDEQCMDIDFEVDAQFVGLTGKGIQFSRAIEVAAEFRRRGKVVLIGGPYASLSPGAVRPHCDILVRGEIEEIAPRLFSDLRSGSWKDEYVGGQPELTSAVLPRWDLYPNDRAVMATVQTSRGCPFECEFCDAIVYLGRKQRHKPVELVRAELEAVYAHGYRKVYLGDDNTPVHRRRATEILETIRDWNRAQTDGHIEFTTQGSIDVAADRELVDLCAQAGIVHMFVGVETPSEESLRETKKRQNLVDMAGRLEFLVQRGIAPSSGSIVGFDNDGPDIFERQLEFFRDLPIPHISVSTLVAPEGTPLYERMAAEGRLIESGAQVTAHPGDSNIISARLTADERRDGLAWLVSNLYDPECYEARVLRFIELLGERQDPSHRSGHTESLRDVDEASIQLVTRVPELGSREALMFRNVMTAARRKPAAASFIGSFFVLYMGVRCVYERTGLWRPELAGQPCFA